MKEELRRDYRGLLLCKTCWNGEHFSKPEKNVRGKWVPAGEGTCICKLGGCECPCSQMRDGWQEHLASKRERERRNKAAQLPLQP